MKNVILFDTSIGSFNRGDDIIMKYSQKHLSSILNDKYVIKLPTHTPSFELWQRFKNNGRYRYIKNADYKFICGTNLLSKSLLRPWPNFNLNIFNTSEFKNSILVGVGTTQSCKIDIYTKTLYKKILSKKYYHSARDEKTKVFIEQLGFKALNTGCPTMWSLTKDFCSKIPKQKSKDVIFTLTNDCPSENKDKYFIDILLKNYKNIYFFPQSIGDVEYFKKLNKNNIHILPNNIDFLSKFMNEGSLDYIGTRLHCGIFALNHKLRSIILSIDNRAIDISETYKINCISRNDIEKIEDTINSVFETNVGINEANIDFFKRQFI